MHFIELLFETYIFGFKTKDFPGIIDTMDSFNPGLETGFFNTGVTCRFFKNTGFFKKLSCLGLI
jgi:hypothetical protein